MPYVTDIWHMNAHYNASLYNIFEVSWEKLLVLTV